MTPLGLSELIAPYVTGDDPGHAVGVYGAASWWRTPRPVTR